jgi:hypothetical protein
MNKLQINQMTFLMETVNHYNLKNRGMNENGQCCYVGGCAIGRHLPKELAKILDTFGNTSISNTEVFNLLPDNLKALGQSFLQSVQFLHDSSDFWDNTGLTDVGQIRVKLICDTILSGSYKA